MLHQQNGQLEAAMEMLQRGLRHHPRSPQLNICLGIVYADQGRYDQALEHLTPYDTLPETPPHIIRCLRALGRTHEADEFAGRQMK
jgi:lipopolysaccharide biosynthesis regulator YciM